MFTIRFEMHENNSYVVYQCERYSVRYNEGVTEDGSITATVVRMFRSIDDDNPFFENISSENPIKCAYVTNESGRTIDRITE